MRSTRGTGGMRVRGAWQSDGEETSINRYMIDFEAWEQRDLDNDRRRSVRLGTGQQPEKQT